MPVHILWVNSYTNIQVHTSTYLYIPVYHSICQYKRIWNICITIGLELTTACIVSAWLYRFARSINASVYFLSFLWYILWLCTVPGTRRLAAGVGCLARVPRASTFLSWVSTTDRPPSCITMLSSKTCYMISTYQYIPVHTIFGLYIQAHTSMYMYILYSIIWYHATVQDSGLVDVRSPPSLVPINPLSYRFIPA